jgi:prepilin-type N-terminal cleavage/methylation domain-containing protein
MQTKQTTHSRQSGFTLAETMVSIMILGLVFAGTLLTYTRAEQRAEWSGYSLAAEMLCAKTMEQFHAVLWDTQTLPTNNGTLNIPLTSTNLLDIPVAGTNAVWAVTTANITSFAGPGPCYYEMITVNTAWAWQGQNFTNTLVAYRAPDQ